MSINIEFSNLREIHVHRPMKALAQRIRVKTISFKFTEEDGAEVTIYCRHKMAKDVRDQLLELYPLAPPPSKAVGPIPSLEEVEEEDEALAEPQRAPGQGGLS